MEYGCEAWKSQLDVLMQLMGHAQKQYQALKKGLQELHWQRKSTQTQGGEKLREYESQWVGFVSKNYEIEQACVHLEEELYKLKMMAREEMTEAGDVPVDEPGVPGGNATEVMAAEMDEQQNYD